MGQTWSRRPVRSAGAFLGPGIIVGVPVRTLSDDYQDRPVDPESDDIPEPAGSRRRNKVIGALISVVALIAVPLLMLAWRAPATVDTVVPPLARICFGAPGTDIGGGAGCDALPVNQSFRSTDSLGLQVSTPFGGALNGNVQLTVSRVEGSTEHTVATWAVQPDPDTTTLTTALPTSLFDRTPGTYIVRASQDGATFAQGSLTIVRE